MEPGSVEDPLWRRAFGGAATRFMDRLLALRDRALGDPQVLRFTSRLFLTRPVARVQARALFDLCAGFVYAQTLAACVQLDLFALLAAGPLTPAAIGARLALPPEGVAALVEAGCALGLLARRGGGRIGLGMLGAALRGDPGITAMIRHHAMLYDDLRDPVAALRRGGAGSQLGAYWAYAGSGGRGGDGPAERAALSPAQVGGYTALMAASQPMIADAALCAYDFGRHRVLLDVGGGDGSFLRAVGARHPALKLCLFDVAAVADLAAARFAAAGMEGRTEITGGDFRTDALPRGADIISFVRVLHDHDDDVVARLLAQARAALPPGGIVLICEPMADTRRAAAYFSLYLRTMGSGRPRSSARLCAMLRAAGFAAPRVRATPTPLLARVITAECKS